MHFSTIAAGLAAVAGVSAREIMVQIGAPPMRDVFMPDSVTAGPGDYIRFRWVNGFHYVAQSDFNTPCVQSSNGWGSPVQRNSSAVDWILQINSTDTQIAYCGVGDHCQMGMALIINPSNAPNAPTLRSYQDAAANAMSQPAMARGGLLANQTGALPASASPSSGSMPSSSGSPSPTSSAPASMSSTSSNDGALMRAGAGAVAAGFAAVAYVL